MIYLYSFILYVLSPILPLYLKYRGRKNPNYLLNWHERFGINLIKNTNKPIIWLHAVSVGETRAMVKLIGLLTEYKKEYQILITNMTPTGRETAKTLFPEAIVHYLPYDLSFSVKQFYKKFKPIVGIIMETEIWPNLIYYADKNKIPLYLVNARLSDKSYKGYNRFKNLLMPILNKLNGILCQDTDTEGNFKKLGFSGMLNTIGNTKFDLSLPDNYKIIVDELNLLIDHRKVICFASTRDGEEEIIFNNINLDLDVIYLIIPRHPERFTVCEQLCISRKINYVKRSTQKKISFDTKVIIGDSMGEMLGYYSISYLVVMGGSFGGFGGQNPLEAFYMNIPVVFGKSMFNFKKIVNDALKYECGIQLEEATDLKHKIADLINNQEEYAKYQKNCKKFINSYQGASQKIFNVIKEQL